MEPDAQESHVVGSSIDREEIVRSMGITRLAFKVLTSETAGGLFLIEQTFLGRGGPPRHVHPHQDEWFYALEGEFVVVIGGNEHRLGPGDSVLAPRAIPHVWAFVGAGSGRLLVGFTPAGHMEAFFREVTKTEAMPTQDPALWEAHGMEVVGPPYALA